MDPHKDYPLFNGFIHLAAGLCCGMTGLAAGYAIGIVGDTVSSVKFPGIIADSIEYSVYEHMFMSRGSS